MSVITSSRRKRNGDHAAISRCGLGDGDAKLWWQWLEEDEEESRDRFADVGGAIEGRKRQEGRGNGFGEPRSHLWESQSQFP